MLSTLECYKTKYLGPLLAKYHMLKANDASHCRNWRLEEKKTYQMWKVDISKVECIRQWPQAMQNKF